MKIWSPKERRCAEDAVAHAGGKGVVACVWSAAIGARDGGDGGDDVFRALATGDAAGHVAFWTVDRRARPEKIAELSLEKAFGGSHTARAVTHILAAPTGEPRRDAEAGFFRFLVGYARADDAVGGSAMCAADVRNVPAPDAESARERRDKPVVTAALLFESAEPFAAALGRGGGDASRDFISSDATGDATSDADAEPFSSIPFSVVTLGADATLRCHAPPSPGWRAADAATPGGFKPKTSGCWTETLAFKLPVEGVTSEGLAWAREGVLAAVSDKDPSGAVRMFDLESGANYALRARESASDAPGPAGDASSRDPASRRLTCVARDGDSGALAVGSRDGRVTVFRRVGGSDEDARRRAGGEKKKVPANDTDASSASRKPSRRGDSRGYGRARWSRGGLEKDADAEDEDSESSDEGSSGSSDENERTKTESSDERAWCRSATTHVPGATRVTALRFAEAKSSRVLSALVETNSASSPSVSSDEHPTRRGSATSVSGTTRQTEHLAAHVLARVRLADKVRHGVSLAHLTETEVLVESALGAFPPRAFRSGAGQILGADVAGDFLLVWTAKHAETHAYGADGFERLGRFPHHAANASATLTTLTATGERTHADEKTRDARSMRSISCRAPIGAQTLALGVRGELLRVFRPGRVAGAVEVCEPGGAPRDALAYDKAHGSVACVDVNDSGAFLSVATRGGYVHSWWLGGRSPSARFDFAPNGARAPTSIDAPIESVKTNADGSCLLVSFGLEPSGSSHVCVYDVANDAWASLDFAAQIGRVAETVAWDCRFPSMFCAQTARLETSPPSSSFSSSSRSNATEGSVSADESLTDASLVDARFREDRDRAGVVAFTCFAARRDGRSFSKDDANASAKDEKTRAGKDENPEGKDAVCFIAPQESHVLPDGFDAVLGVAAPCLFVSRKADARAKSGDRSAPARGACFSVCMRDFEGVDAVAESNHHENENENDDVASSLLAFHEALASTSFSGRTVSRDPNERALRAAKKLTHPAAWLCAGRASVRRKRLEIAELCLSHTGHVRGARAARDAALYAEPDARVAAVATHLGLLEDAERLYRGCGRFDLLAELYAASGRWRDAARLAEARDRVHLRSTHYAHARHLERLGDVAGAVRAYEKSGRAHREVPRLLRARGETHALEAYVARRSARRDGSPLLDDDDDAKTRVDDSRLRLWRARCLESEGDAEGALAEYLACGAFLDATRAYCAAGDLAGAAETVRRAEEGVANANASETHSDGETPVASRAGPSREHVLAASAFHLARAFEARDAIGEAIAYFSKAGRFGHAMRLATRHGMDGEAARLALKSVRCEKSAAETARFFLRRGDFTRAAALFAKAGSTRAAAELCFEHDLFEPLAEICENLLVPVSRGTSFQKDVEEKTGDDEEKTERSALLRRCASWLAERGRFEHAVLLEARAGDRAAALRLALEKDVKVDEKMADALVGDGDNAALLDVARLCKRRGEYALSCKLYAKAGERSKAMKALLKTGDAEKVIFFAGVSRDRDAYVMAANFLQTLDWRGDETGAATETKETKDKTSPDIAKHIVSFYQKAKAYGHLAGFYESCAATEVDEFRDYDAALVALREARRCRAKALAKTEKNETDDETRVSRERTHLAAVDAAVRAIGRFLDARASLSDDHERASAAIRSLSDDMAKESATHGARAPVATVRAGDAFAMLVEHAFGSQRDAAAAHALLAEMRARGIPVAEYVDGDMLRDIARECGKDALE